MENLPKPEHPEATVEPTKSSANIEVPEGATLKPLLRGPSEKYGGSPGHFVYTTAEGKYTEPTDYSCLDYERTADDVSKTDVIDNKSGETLGTIELRPGVKGATLITSEGESTYLTATGALGTLIDKLSKEG